MKKHKDCFTVYPQNRQATNLSIVSGGARLLSILLLLASIPALIAVLVMIFRLASFGGLDNIVLYMIEEMDDELVMTFGLWCAAAVCRYAASVLSAKAELLSAPAAQQSEPAEIAPQAGVDEN